LGAMQNNTTASDFSTRIKKNRFCFSGKVIRGVDLGARFGVATANVDTDFLQMKIAEGVYFVEVKISPLARSLMFSKGESEEIEIFHTAIMHYGPRKTFGGEKSIEIHLLDFSGDLYDQILQVQVLKFHRPIQKFPNADVLFTQIEHDITKAKKYFLRAYCQKKWSKVSSEDKQLLVQKTVQKLSDRDSFQSAQNILLFVPLRDEIPFAKDLFYRFPDKKFFFPRVQIDTKIMQFFVSDWDELVPGPYTLEPKVSEKYFDPTLTQKTLIFVPALAVSSQGKRLGRGAGFYDKFLADCVANQNISTISVQPEFAVFEDTPVENHDQILDEILMV
jgi:5,10-methenyltetrahydrofolate synthetase